MGAGGRLAVPSFSFVTGFPPLTDQGRTSPTPTSRGCTLPPNHNGGQALPLEFLHISSGGGLGKGTIGGVEMEVLGQFGVFDRFFPQQGDEV